MDAPPMNRNNFNDPLNLIDPDIHRIIEREKERQEYEINLIASENATSMAVLEATSCVMTNKYAEGYPRKRYYAGCEHVDSVEELACDRIKQLFGAEHANVQPHSGSQANAAVLRSFLNYKDPILGMDLAAGGHLTHGHPMNFSGKDYTVFSYGLDKKTELIDYDDIERKAIEHKPKVIIAGGSAYSRIIDFERFADIAKKIDARLWVDMAHIAGLVATGLHPNPVPYADYVTFTTHKTLRGPRGGVILCKQQYAKAIDREVMPGTQGGPKMNEVAAKAVAFGLALQPSFKAYQQQVIANAQAMADELQKNGFKIVSGGTDNHLFLVDVTSKGATGVKGKEAENALQAIGIVVNKNCLPFDENAWKPHGIRIGTPTITTRGMKEEESRMIARYISQAIEHHDKPEILASIATQTRTLAKAFPVYAQPEIYTSTTLDRPVESQI